MRARVLRSSALAIGTASLVLLAGCSDTESPTVTVTSTATTVTPTPSDQPAATSGSSTAQNPTDQAEPSSEATSGAPAAATTPADTRPPGHRSTAPAATGGRVDCGTGRGSADHITWTEGGLSCEEGRSTLDAFLDLDTTRQGDKGGTVGEFDCSILGAATAEEYGYALVCRAPDGRGVFQGLRSHPSNQWADG